MESSPKGTVGRLVHITKDDMANLNGLFGSGVSGWVGGRRYIIGDPGWNPQTTMPDWRWMEGEGNCTSYMNSSLVGPYAYLTSSTSTCMYYNSWYRNSLACTSTYGRICQYYFPSLISEYLPFGS